MPMNQSMKGKEYEPVTFEVTGADVEQFADAIGDPSPLYRDAEAARAAGFAERVAPPTFLTKMQMQASAQVVLDQDLRLTHVEPLHLDALAKSDLLALLAQRQEGPRVARRDLAAAQCLLHRLRKLKQADQVGNRRAIQLQPAR